MKKCFFKIIIALTSVTMMGQELQNFGRQTAISPEIRDGKVTFRISAPNATSVVLIGSWMAQNTRETLTKDENGLWSVTINLPKPELYTYNFVVDGISVNDNANIFVQRDGRRFLSILLVDGPNTANYREASKRGNLNQVWYDSPTIGTNRRMFVYTPYGYDDSNQKYPVLYLLHGAGGDEDAWSNMGRACQILDNLIEQGKAKPMLVVMPNGNPGQQAAPTMLIPQTPMERNNPAMANIYPQSIVKDIVPYIEKHYRVIAEPDGRALAGLSMGGGHTVTTTTLYPGFFSYIVPLSAAVMQLAQREQAAVDSELQAIKKAGYKLYWLACGTEDFIWESSKNLDEALTRNGMEHTFRITDGGHTWANWRIYLNEFATLLFK